MVTDQRSGELIDLSSLQSAQVTATCRKCSRQWQANALIGPLLSRPIIPNLCDPCSKAMEEESKLLAKLTNDQRRQTAADARERTWERLCPKEYRLTSESAGNTQLARLELECKQLPRILQWQFQERGLVLRSRASGRCKTRAMWRLLRRLFNDERTIGHYTAGAFQRRAQDEAGKYTIDAWFNTLAKLDVIFLDDLGKGFWTENTEALWFDLVEHRSRDGKPVLVTTNYNGDELIQGSRSEATTYTIRRLRDYCDSIVFD